MLELRRKVLLPAFRLSEHTTDDDPRAVTRKIDLGDGLDAFAYQYRFVTDERTGEGVNYNLFPVVLGRDSVPWAEGCLYILAQLESRVRPNMATQQSKADDLGAFKEWIDSQDNPEDLVRQFPRMKLRRPTYRYRGHLQQLVYAGEIGPHTAKRRMATVVAFYRWLIDSKFFTPEYPPWEERQYHITIKSNKGFLLSKNIRSTDVVIRAPKSDDPFAGYIQDGGRLRPLTGREQEWIFEATKRTGNTECYLLQLFMLSTGARIQTAATLRFRTFTQADPQYSSGLSGDGQVFKLRAGPGTNIDTKNAKSGVLQIPRPVYELIRTYALSTRAGIRRERFLQRHGDHSDPYVFLTQQGNPYYTANSDCIQFDAEFDRRHEKTGQTLRQFIKDQVIPFVRENHSKTFQYRVHDLRASFGMNMTERLADLVKKNQMTPTRARMIVKDLLWHESLATTDLYLNHRSQMSEIYAAVNGYGEQLQRWVEFAMRGMEATNG